MEKDQIRKAVREGYAQIAKVNISCCGPGEAGCCGTSMAKGISKGIGYTDKDIDSVPEGANMGLGCGNPVALASLKQGEIVLDLGCGAGFDCFLAAKHVGGAGKVIGVDMTIEMLEKARENAVGGGYRNIEFRLGEIEHLPVADNYVDIIISNCVINLSTDKESVFREAYRVLKPGGRLMISDIVLIEELPSVIKQSIAAYIGCMAGATLKGRYLEAVRSAGFKDVKIIEESAFSVENIFDESEAEPIFKNKGMSGEELKKLEGSVLSIKVSALK